MPLSRPVCGLAAEAPAAGPFLWRQDTGLAESLNAVSYFPKRRLKVSASVQPPAPLTRVWLTNSGSCACQGCEE